MVTLVPCILSSGQAFQPQPREGMNCGTSSPHNRHTRHGGTRRGGLGDLFNREFLMYNLFFRWYSGSTFTIGNFSLCTNGAEVLFSNKCTAWFVIILTNSSGELFPDIRIANVLSGLN